MTGTEKGACGGYDHCSPLILVSIFVFLSSLHTYRFAPETLITVCYQ